MDRQFTRERIVLTVPEAARALGIGREQAYRACRRGELPAIRIGRRILVSREALKLLVSTPHIAADLRSHRSLGASEDPRSQTATHLEVAISERTQGSRSCHAAEMEQR
jgi:excisionase family DNA binding protein